MNKTILVAFLASALFAFVPTAAASHCGDAPTTAPATTIDVAGVATFYVTSDGAVWQETNGHAGFQNEGSTCTQKNSGKTVPVTPDTRVI